jgi:hypothetical protein
VKGPEIFVDDAETSVNEKRPFSQDADLEMALVHRKRTGVKYCLTLGGLQELLELLGPDTLLGIGAPLDARRADGPRVQMPALLALGVGLIAPDLDLLAALLAPDILGLGRTYFRASWTTFFKHDQTLPRRQTFFYDAGHMAAELN